MAFLGQLWIPILASAVLVFVASSLIHMVLKWHNKDYHGFSNEDAVRAALSAGSPAPGEYMVPYCSDMKQMSSPEMMKKFQDGPIVYMAVRAGMVPSMGKPLGLWFALNVAISIIAAYIAAKTLTPTATPGQVCRVVGTLAFLAYGAGSVQSGIWWGKPWGSVAKDLLDALIYAIVMGATFAWLWH
jgi:hypothetical protein